MKRNCPSIFAETISEECPWPPHVNALRQPPLNQLHFSQ